MTYAALGSEFLVNTSISGDQLLPDVTALTGGGYVICWTDPSGLGGDSSGYSVKAQLYANDGTPVGTEFLVNTNTFSDQKVAQVAALDNGGFAITWFDYSNQSGDNSGSGIVVRLYGPDGTPTTAEIPVNTITTNDQVEPYVAGLAGGGFVVTWIDYSNEGGDTSVSAVRAQVFASDGSPVGTEILVNTQTNDYQIQPQIAGLENGNFVVTWTDRSGIGGDSSNFGVKAQLFAADGTKIGDEFLVNTELPNEQADPTVTGLAGGGFVITWNDHSQLGADTSGWGIKAQIYDANGAAIGGEFLVNTVTFDEQQGPSIAALPDGGFVITWMDYAGTFGGAGGGIKAQVFNADGTANGTEFLVNSIDDFRQLHPDVAAQSDGSFLITWISNGAGGDGGGDYGVKAQIFIPDEPANSAPVVPDSPAITVDEQTATIINAALTVSDADLDARNGGNGDYSGATFIISRAVANAEDLFSFASSGAGFSVNGASLEAGGQVFGTIAQAGGSLTISFTSSGTPATTALVNDVLRHLEYTNTSDAPPATVTLTYSLNDGAPGGGQGDVVGGNNIDVGEILVTLNDVPDAVVGYEPQGGEFVVNTLTDYSQTDPAVAQLETGGFVITWQGSGLRAQVFAADGSPVGDEFLVAQPVGGAFQQTITSLEGGGFVVTWAEYQGANGVYNRSAIMARIYSADGTPVGDAFQASDPKVDFLNVPEIGSLAGGGFVIAWTDQSGDGTGLNQYGIRAQIFDASGSSVGSEFIVNTVTVSSQTYPAITGLAEGGFVISWTDSSGIGGDSSHSAVKAQVFAPDGSAVGGEFLVNTATSSQQSNSAIAALSGGGFVVVWFDYSHVGGDPDTGAIKAQIYGADGSPIGSEFLVNSTIAGQQGQPDIAALPNGGFVVTWMDGSNVTSENPDWDIRAQAFSADGARIGDEFLVNTMTNFYQGYPSVTSLDDGRLVIAWEDYSSSPNFTNSEIKAQIFSPVSGAPDQPADAQDDAFTTSELNLVTGNLFADNGSGADSDPDGPPLTISEVNGSAADVGSEITLASGAKLTVNADGSFSYNPNGAFQSTPTVGSGAVNTPSGDSFTYTLAGGDTATVSLTINGVDNNDTVTGNENGNRLIGGAGNDSISGLGGNDYITGGNGDDFIDGGDGAYDRAGWYQTNEALGGAMVDLNIAGAQNTGSQGWDTITGIENLSGSPFADQLTGDGNNNWLWGSGIYLFGAPISSSNNDMLDGQGGDDLLIVGQGTHTLIGGTGTDSLQYTENGGPEVGISVDLFQQGAAQDTGAGSWTLTGIENVSGGSANDFLQGDGNANILAGAAGADIINGGGGNDTLAGDGSIAVQFVGGSTGPATFEPLVSRSLVGAIDGNDTLSGGGGDDTLYGGGGNDTLRGNGDNDTIYGNSGNDFIAGGFGNDLVDGGDGFDRAGNYHTDEIAGGVTIDLNIAGAQNTGGQGTDTFIGIENLSGTPFADSLTGDNNNNWLWGSPATIAVGWVSATNNDMLDGQGGDDLLTVGIGSHTLIGGDGSDWLQYTENGAALEPGITLSLGQVAPQVTGAGTWTLSGIENFASGGGDDNLTGTGGANIIAGGLGNDTINGDGGGDTLLGDGFIQLDASNLVVTFNDAGALGGNDILSGGGGDDTLYGGAGNDTLRGNADNDSLDGGIGDDLLVGGFGDDLIAGGDGYDRAGNYHLNEALGGVTIDLNIVGAQDTGSQGWDTLTGIEYVSGTPWADTLIGDANDNILWGSVAMIDPGTNWVSTSNNDTLDGGDGNDLLYAGIGNHSLTGGDGIDTVGFTENWGDDPVIRISLAMQGVAQDTGQGLWTLDGIENLSGGNDDDELTGDGNANVLAGSFGNDLLAGSGGHDSLYGDGAFDSAAPSSGAPTLFPDVGADGNDVLDGGDGDDQLYGGGGNDQLLGGQGNDLLDGGEGQDLANYGPETGFGPVTVDLGAGTASNGGGNDTLVGIEDVLGTGNDDLLIGDGVYNVLNGGGGNDTIDGAGGDDTLMGGDGHDQLQGGEGNDQLIGGAGIDVLDGGAGRDVADYQYAVGGVTALLYENGFGEKFGAEGYDQLQNIEDLNGSAFNDILYADNLDNYVSGNDGHDDVRGGGGNDQVHGGSGDDLLYGNAGDDYLDGGDGYDRVGYFTDATAGVTVDLNLQGQAQDTGQGMDTLVNIENVSGTKFGDTLVGDDNDNALWGSAATLSGIVSPDNNDTLIGGGGNDLLIAGIGNHTLDGGSGIDTFRFTENGVPETGITLSLLLAGSAQASGNGSWTLTGIENLSGSIAGDNLTGDGNANVLAGDLGDDSLSGGGGNDTLYGDGQIMWDAHGTGRSGPIITTPDATGLYVGGVPGNDTLEGGLGDDFIDGGAGSDTASYANAAGGVTAFLYRFGNGNGESAGADGFDLLEGIENLTGSAFADSLAGNNLANVIDGGDGNDGLRGYDGDDTLLGGGGNDFLNGGLGNDIVNGGSGFDRAAFYEDAGPSGVTVDLNIAGPQDTGQGMDTLIGIENVSGSVYGDTLTGDEGDNQLWGSASTLSGGTIVTTNHDTLSGNGGNDLLVVGIGNHIVDGGTGIDTFRFTENGAPETGITLSLLLQGDAQATANGNWTLTNIENLSGSQSHDTLIGDGNANILAGERGNDLLAGGGGDDTLYGDGGINVDGFGSGPITTFPDVVATFGGVSGDDTLEGGDGNDQLFGGGGTDTASYANASGGVQVTLFNNLTGNGSSSGADGDDLLFSIENLIGSAYNDNLTGSAAANVLTGGDGNDFLQARGGDDSLHGGDGNDYVGGGTGNDLLDGGAGYDRASFSNGSTGPVTVDLRIQGVAQNTGLGMDTLIGIENASGTAFADTFIGDDGDNWLWGGSDAPGAGDTIDGQGGNDLIENGVGNHNLSGGTGIDTFAFNPFTTPTTVTISLALQGAAQDTGAGIMTLDGFENLSGSSFADTLIGDGNDNVLAGSEAGDTLIGGAGNDTLYGDGLVWTGPEGPSGAISTLADVADVGGIDGDDTLEGGDGNDQLFGGGGNDTASYATASGAVFAGLGAGGSGGSFGAAGNDSFNSIENLTGSEFNDQFGGNSEANILAGNGGHDIMVGRGGDDTLLGGDGDDYLRGDDDTAGNDIIDGGSGWDRAVFNLALTGVTVDLNIQGVAQDTGLGMDTLISIEHASGSTFNDTITGDGGDNWLRSWGGDDVISGNGGDDLIETMPGNNVVDGGSGVDSWSFYGDGTFFASGVTVSLALQGTAQDTGQGSMLATDFENLSGTIHADTLAGDDGANVIAGDAGSDTLSGGAGNDTLYGDGSIFVDWHGDGGSGPITQFADVTLVLGGVAGDDLIEGGLGDDQIDGGGGVDTASYANAGGGVNVNLGSGFASGADGNDSLTNIENVIGSQFNDTLNGDGGGNVLDGLGGNDVIQGQGGNDTIYGGDGDDTLRGDAGELSLTVSGDDVIYGGAGNDGLRGGLGNDQLYGGDNNDLLRGNGGIDFFDGGANDAGETFNGIGDRVSFFEQRATQGAVADLRTGIISNDGFGNVETMVGIESLGGDTAFADIFHGNDDANALLGSLGDSLYGHGGNDFIQFSSAGAVVDGGAGTDRLVLVTSGGWLLPDSNGDGLAETAGAATAGWSIDLAAGTTLDGYGNVGSIAGIENIDGTIFADTLFGDFNANVLNGGGGNDFLQARGGDDTVSGHEGNDYLGGGTGNDLLDGGDGYDRASFANGSTAGVTVDLRQQGVAQDTGLGLDTLIGIEHVSGTIFSDTLTGDDGDNWLWGVSDSAAPAGDTIDGQGGNDLIEVGAGNHVITGGSGTDTLRYNPFGTGSVGATLSLALLGVQDTGAGMMTLNGIENLSGGDFNDNLTGDGGANQLAGGLGNDSLAGGAGDDSLYGDGQMSIDTTGGSGPIIFYPDVGAAFGVADGDDLLNGGLGNDLINGGGGTDTASYANAGGAVTVNLFAGTASGADGNDTLSNVENITGSAFADTLVGSVGANVIDGGDGLDTLLGLGGTDTLQGGAGSDNLFGHQGNDSLNGGDGNDNLFGGTGNDVIDGGAGFNLAGYAPNTIDPIASGVTVDLNLQGVAQNTGQGMDTLLNIQGLNGTQFADILIGDGNTNLLISAGSAAGGAGGDDQLFGNGGDDLLIVGSGNVLLDGGSGEDTANFGAAGATLLNGVTVSLVQQGAAQATGSGNMTLTGIENLSGTGLADTLTGDGGDNDLSGSGGHDLLVGGAGNDSLRGDAAFTAFSAADASLLAPYLAPDSSVFAGQVAGNDTLEGGLGDDLLDGGAGTDTAIYANAAGAVTVNLSAGTASGADGNDALSNIENVTGGAFNDILTGSSGANLLIGGDGHDRLAGGDGTDSLQAGTGNDILDGGAGDDTIDGGAGFDRVSYNVGATAGVTVNLGTGQATGRGFDTLLSIENVVGTVFNDTLTGDGGDNWLWGGSLGTGVTGNDIISGGNGNDLIEVGTGSHSLNGGNGTDTLSFWGGGTDITAAGVTFSLASAGAQNSEQGTMTATGFENLSGSRYDDIFTGSSGNNVLAGDVGIDRLSGGDGNDFLYGDGAFTTFTPGGLSTGAIRLVQDASVEFGGIGGADLLLGGRGDDWLYGGTGNDTMTGNQGVDRFVIQAGSGIDHVTDFAIDIDKILFDVSGVDDFLDLVLTKSGTNTLITWGTGDQLILDGVRVANLDAGDFEFLASASALGSDSAMTALASFDAGRGADAMAAADMASTAYLAG